MSGIFPKEAIYSALPQGVVMECCAISQTSGRLFDEEYQAVRSAVPKRRAEFKAGRISARKVLVKLGIRECPILIGRHREPIWPCNVVGSITHHDDYCIVAAAHRSHIQLLGIDVSPLTTFSIDEQRLVCTPEEVELNAEAWNCHRAAIVFSIKESIFKCLFPNVRRYFDFQDVSLSLDYVTGVGTITRLDPSLVLPGGELDIQIRFLFIGSYVFSAAWVTAS